MNYELKGSQAIEVYIPPWAKELDRGLGFKADRAIHRI